MNKLFHRGSTIPVSLGFNCHVRVFIDWLIEQEPFNYPRMPFDYLGTPMWAVYELIKNNFEDFTNKEFITVRKRHVDSQTQYVTNTKYNTVFLHDYGKDIHNIPEKTYALATETYERRIARWKGLVQLKRRILFIRLEQDSRERIIYENSTREESETEYVRKFAEYMKEQKIPYTILYLTTSNPTRFDPDLNICYVHYENSTNAVISGDMIRKIILHSTPFIRSCLL